MGLGDAAERRLETVQRCGTKRRHVQLLLDPDAIQAVAEMKQVGNGGIGRASVPITRATISCPTGSSKTVDAKTRPEAFMRSGASPSKSEGFFLPRSGTIFNFAAPIAE